MSSDGKLKNFVSRLHNIQDDRDALLADLREVIAEAKSEGYEPKALRAVVRKQRANQQKMQELEQIIELYEAAL